MNKSSCPGSEPRSSSIVHPREKWQRSVAKHKTAFLPWINKSSWYTIETTPFVQWQLQSLCSLCQNKNLWSKILFIMLVLWSGTNFHMTSGVHSQKPHSKSVCLARTTRPTVFVLFATPIAGWVSRLGYIFRAPSPSPPPFFVVFVVDLCCWLLYCCWLPSRALLSFYAVLLWSASSPNKMGHSRSLLYYYVQGLNPNLNITWNTAFHLHVWAFL